jgi:hypothetical protein
MMVLIDTGPPVQVSTEEYVRLLGYPTGHDLTGRALELAVWAPEWYARNGRPWVYAREAHSLVMADGCVLIEGDAFRCGRLYRMLTESAAHTSVIAAASAGPEAETEAQKLWHDEKPDEYYFLETFAAAVAEHLIETLGVRLCGWAEEQGMAVLPHHSPGYSGWDVAEQVRLFGLLKTGLPGPLECLDSGALYPKKSLLAVFGLTRRLSSLSRLSGGVPCARCSFQPCQFRRAPSVRRNGSRP